MPTYHLTWEIDLEADSPLEAARLARHYQTKPDTTATVFSVQEHDTTEALRIDLTEIDEDEDGHCRTCGQPYEEGGDGYDGECPDCADQSAAEEEEEDEDWSCDNCGETAMDGSGNCITCGQYDEDAA